MIKTFIFDLGNVIVPFDIDTGLRNLSDKCDLSKEQVREKLVNEDQSKLFHEGKISALELFEAVKKSLNLQMEYNDFVFVWNSIFSFEPIISEKFIENLSKNYRLIILSDTNQLHFDFIESKFPILRFFDDFVLSHEVGEQKPSSKMYKVAVEKAECLPEECFFTDDKKENVIGAENFGINAVQFISAEQFEKHLAELDLIKKEPH